MKRIRDFNINTSEHFNSVFEESPQLYDSYKNIKLYNSLFNLKIFNVKSILDFGCGNATTLHTLEKDFPNTIINGVDISDKIIELNKINYPHCFFYTVNEFLDKKITADTIICTHTIEHVDEPLLVIKNLLDSSNNFLFILVPYKKSWNLCEEHLWEFNKGSFDSFKPTFSIPGIINRAGNREILYFWDKKSSGNRRKNRIIENLLFQVKLIPKHSIIGIIKSLIKLIKQSP